MATIRTVGGVETKAVYLGRGSHEREEALGIEVQRGRLFWCRPNGEEAIYRDEEGDFGFHGTDTPPCEAEWVADAEGPGYLVITGEEAETVECVEGWTCEPADLDVGWTADDGTASVTVVRAWANGIYTIAGYCR